MKKIFKNIRYYLYKRSVWIIFLIFVIFFTLFHYLNKDNRAWGAMDNKLFITLIDGKTSIEVPQDIVKEKDCKKYKEWLDKWATPMIIASDRCPWSKAPKSAIGEFEIKGVKLYIPRNYLLFDKKIPDGNTEGVVLLMKYPYMTPAGDDKERNVFHVSVLIDSKRGCSNEKPCVDTSKKWYENSSGISWNKKNNIPNQIKKLYDLPKEKLIAYRVNNKSEFLIRGNPLNPDYWMRCASAEAAGDSSTSCSTVFDYNNKIYVDYDFSRTYLLKDHDELRARIIAKIDEFRIPPKDE